MANIEKWRVEELSLLLKKLVSVLKEGQNPEWAGVFSHYDEESRLLLATGLVDLTRLRRLIRDIKSCFLFPSSFSSLLLQPNYFDEEGALQIEFRGLQGRLFCALEEIEVRLVEYIH